MSTVPLPGFNLLRVDLETGDVWLADQKKLTPTGRAADRYTRPTGLLMRARAVASAALGNELPPGRVYLVNAGLPLEERFAARNVVFVSSRGETFECVPGSVPAWFSRGPTGDLRQTYLPGVLLCEVNGMAYGSEDRTLDLLGKWQRPHFTFAKRRVSLAKFLVTNLTGQDSVRVLGNFQANALFLHAGRVWRLWPRGA